MSRKRVGIISLGCSKNLVDSERLMRMLDDVGYKVIFEPQSVTPGDIIVINTCGFIGDAKEESVNTILQWVDAKQRGLVAQVYVMGCLSQRYATELPKEIEGVDGWYGKTDWVDLVRHLAHKNPGIVEYDRIITTPRHHAYLKIAEGCNRFCSFCAIPLITGRYKSRPQEQILNEVRLLLSRGVKEFNIIAQDLTNYGVDLYGHNCIAKLIDQIARIDGVKWIRLHYAYPSQFPMELLDVMAKHHNVCKYLDIALQHISDNVLHNMRRHITGDETRKLLKTIREKVPGIHIRTTLMVGFPGEGDREFEELLEFVRTERFERMGAFAYCEEEDTYGAKNFSDDIPESVKTERLDKLMALQENIALEHNQSKVGSELDVIIEREEQDYYIGRTEYDSPEVDPEVFVEKSEILTPGEFYRVKIVDALPFELFGEIVNK
ncbi:MAG: 30S ribosomal protein S12 methylthiotransferase RimO [Paramuribaculum sp.]|nr:30S ribosomal protein S12 methylthiotransferase RimO [Paramuribaculum sp.]